MMPVRLWVHPDTPDSKPGLLMLVEPVKDSAAVSQEAVGVTLTAFHAVTTFLQVAELRP